MRRLAALLLPPGVLLAEARGELATERNNPSFRRPFDEKKGSDGDQDKQSEVDEEARIWAERNNTENVLLIGESERVLENID
jgi:hypothetical protein